VYTFANLAPRAMANHRWYRQTFDDYPGSRKALIPFVLWARQPFGTARPPILRAWKSGPVC
ncbi:MAG: hypothetical protein ABI130_12305, partial [Leifsonia sp.]